MGGVQQCAPLLVSIVSFGTLCVKVLPLLLFCVELFISLRNQSNPIEMKYFESLPQNYQRAVAYLVIFAALGAAVLTMDFLLWLINTTFA